MDKKPYCIICGGSLNSDDVCSFVQCPDPLFHKQSLSTDLDVWVRLCLNWAQKKGWCDRPVPLGEMVALLHSELSEALESWRKKEQLLWFDTEKMEKPEGIMSELADTAIRIFHYCGLQGLELPYFADAEFFVPGASFPEILAEIHSSCTALLRCKDRVILGYAFALLYKELAHVSQNLGYNLLDVCRTKMAYNWTRPFRHGGKRG